MASTSPSVACSRRARCVTWTAPPIARRGDAATCRRRPSSSSPLQSWTRTGNAIRSATFFDRNGHDEEADSHDEDGEVAEHGEHHAYSILHRQPLTASTKLPASATDGEWRRRAGVGARSVGVGAAVIEEPGRRPGAQRDDGRVEAARMVDEVARAIEDRIVGVGRERGVVGGDGGGRSTSRAVWASACRTATRGRSRSVRGEPQAQARRAVSVDVALGEGRGERVDVGPQRRARGGGRQRDERRRES